jgi:hypothetical protein
VATGRGLHSSTFQLNLSHFCRKIHTRHSLKSHDTSYTRPTQPLNPQPVPQKALTLSQKVHECKPLATGGQPLHDPTAKVTMEGKAFQQIGALKVKPSIRP